jgi:hypothetical protein
MYADSITESMQKTIDETSRRRMKQLQYNVEHGITPKQIVKAINTSLSADHKELTPDAKEIRIAAYPAFADHGKTEAFAADPIVRKMSREQLEKSIENTKALMKQAAKDLDFIQAAQYRDELLRLQEELEEKVSRGSKGEVEQNYLMEIQALVGNDNGILDQTQSLLSKLKGLAQKIPHYEEDLQALIEVSDPFESICKDLMRRTPEKSLSAAELDRANGRIAEIQKLVMPITMSWPHSTTFFRLSILSMVVMSISHLLVRVIIATTQHLMKPCGVVWAQVWRIMVSTTNLSIPTWETRST